jgi:hypothetical protein
MSVINYLIPVDAKLARLDHVEDETLMSTRALSKAELTARSAWLSSTPAATIRRRQGSPCAVGRGLSPMNLSTACWSPKRRAVGPWPTAS